MAAPKIGIQVEPAEAGTAHCLVLGSRTVSGQTGVKVVLRLRLQNAGTSTVKVNGIRFSFPAPRSRRWTCRV